MGAPLRQPVLRGRMRVARRVAGARSASVAASGATVTSGLCSCPATRSRRGLRSCPARRSGRGSHSLPPEVWGANNPSERHAARISVGDRAEALDLDRAPRDRGLDHVRVISRLSVSHHPALVVIATSRFRSIAPTRGPQRGLALAEGDDLSGHRPAASEALSVHRFEGLLPLEPFDPSQGRLAPGPRLQRARLSGRTTMSVFMQRPRT
jgi:hypothetical protein